MPRTKGAKQYGDEEVKMLLNIIQKCEPLRKKDWETEVSRRYNVWAEKNGLEVRDVESLRKKFTTLSKVSPDEYRGRLPPEHRLAMRIRNRLHGKRRAELAEQEEAETADHDGSPHANNNTLPRMSRAAHTTAESDDDDDDLDLSEKSAIEAFEKQSRKDNGPRRDAPLIPPNSSTGHEPDNSSSPKRQRTTSPDRIDRRLQELFSMMIALQRESISEDSNVMRALLREMKDEIELINKQLGRLESSVQNINVNLRSLRDCVVSAGGKPVFAGLSPNDKDGDDSSARQLAAQEA